MNNKDFKIGDRVELLDDNMSGQVIFVEQDEITFTTEDGFDMTFPTHLLVKIENEIDVDLADDALQQKIQSDLKSRSKRPSQKAVRDVPAMEVDLHIHHLVDKTAHLSNFEMLNIQLDHSRLKIEFAIEKRIKKIVFIHGVGQGVLKAELETLFRRYDQIEFYDADYQKYGLGATEIYIYDS